MDLNDVRMFVRIVDAGSLSAATRALRIPKSTMSRSLARLEDRLRTKLFERGARSLRLTEAGRLFLPHARRILDDVAEADAALDGVTGSPQGTLRINAAITFALGIVAPMIPAFVARYPGVRVMLDTENRVVDLAREEVDVAIRVGSLPNSDLIARKLGSVELWPCASAAYLAARGTPRTPADLGSHVLLGWLDQPAEWRFTDATGVRHIVPVLPGTLAPEPAVLQVLLSGGIGIGRLPDFLARPATDKGTLCRILPDYATEAVEVHAVYAARRSLSAKVRLFIDELGQSMILR
ncbi:MULTISPECIES: LysR family transcriptional regulator [unclassified Sphingomonas]|uniref:LysR family transcriptional regulator n=1 Tax=unclassified Sphingomonas TaxID=196159 RepID=UPI00226A65CA|nr:MULTISPECIES: LysR family transcriptional regulator [unclassified Sphingomonas]